MSNKQEITYVLISIKVERSRCMYARIIAVYFWAHENPVHDNTDYMCHGLVHDGRRPHVQINVRHSPTINCDSPKHVFDVQCPTPEIGYLCAWV